MINEILELRSLLRNYKLSPVSLKALQEHKLRTVIRHAYDKVPYYRALFESAGLSPPDIRTVEDLQYVPVTTKEALKSAGVENITAKGIDLTSCIAFKTSGSTGIPFTVYRARSEARSRQLIDFRALLSIGFRPQDRLLIVGPERARPARLHNRLGLYRTTVISSLLSVEEQIQCLKTIQPTVLWIYPTLLRALLHKVDYRLSKIVRPWALITSAEVFDEVMKERLLADLDMHMFNFYGTMEVGRIGTECRAHAGLHVNADSVILECLRDDNAAGESQSGTAVVTSLNGFAMPFIRYRIGDPCTLSKERCPCGSSFPLIDPPQGRCWDMIKLPSGKLLSPFGLSFLLRSFDGIDQFRLIQERPEHLVLQLVSQKNFSPASLLQLQSRFMDHLQEPMNLEIQRVQFMREDSPKFKTFVSKIP